MASLEAVLGERMLQAWRLRAEALQADRRRACMPACFAVGMWVMLLQPLLEQSTLLGS